MDELKKMALEHQQKYMKQQRRKGALRPEDFGVGMAGDKTMPELGDACIAAPFTFKFSSIKCVQRVISQGRTTISTTYQMYKILAMNSIISAYTMSALYLEGVKNSDSQMTYAGMAMGILFMLISLSKPIDTLSKIRPPRRLFHWSFVLTVILQTIFHFCALYYIIQLSEPYST